MFVYGSQLVRLVAFLLLATIHVRATGKEYITGRQKGLLSLKDDHFDRLETVRFFRLFTREGDMEYKGCGKFRAQRHKG
jgi:hypothetical protein